ncbi:hypothetical protein N0V88_006435 [Collariella sp. IMI 366227]|nr:hypothetical protein N0V88_006435 [Collariella sp. IMI 366227]
MLILRGYSTPDREVLEAAFKISDKPDKHARLEIVSRVSMNEKQVQIWFQNKRQDQRRKSRPYTYTDMDLVPGCVTNPPTHRRAASSGDLSMYHLLPHAAPPSLSSPEQPAAVPPSSYPQAVLSSDELENTSAPSQELGTDSAAEQPAERIGHHGPSRSFAGPVGYVSNRWNAASSFPPTPHLGSDDPFRRRSFPPTHSAPMCPGPAGSPLELQPAQLRLSMSLEGKAEVVVPSPPRASVGPPPSEPLQPIRRPELQPSRSESRISLPSLSEVFSSTPTSSTPPLPPRLSRGRSRDVHAWESICDSDNCDDALTAQAKHESSGSATAQISLIRSMSTSSANWPREKRSAPSTLPRPGEGKRPRLSRAHSSAARMEAPTVLGPSHRQNSSNLQRVSCAVTDKRHPTPTLPPNAPSSGPKMTTPKKKPQPRPLR